MTMNQKTTISLRQFVFRYILPLFLAALVLVLAAYFNEMRSQKTAEQLQMINDALEERDERISALESRVADLEQTQIKNAE